MLVADKASISLTHMAIAFTLAHPAVTSTIIGPRTREQLDDLLGAADVRLDAETLDAIDELVPPGTIVDEEDRGFDPWCSSRSATPHLTDVLTDVELDSLEHAASSIPLSSFEFVADDYVIALFDTVLDYQNQAAAIQKAEDHYRANHYDEIRTLDELEAVLDRFPGRSETATTSSPSTSGGTTIGGERKSLRGLVRYFR